MAKDKERKLAYIYYVEHGKTAKECASLVDVTEKTVGDWVDKFGWKSERDNRLFSAKERITNIKLIINNCAEERLRLNEDLDKAIRANDADEIKEVRQKMASLSDEASKWNKTLANLDKESKISLEVYITVMEDIFKQLQLTHPKLYMKLLDFQEDLIRTKAIELG